MSSEGRQSPRAAIRDWLSHKDGESISFRPRLDFANEPEEERTLQEKHPFIPQVDNGEALLHPRAGRRRNRRDSQGDKFERRFGELLELILENAPLTK